MKDKFNSSDRLWMHAEYLSPSVILEHWCTIYGGSKELKKALLIEACKYWKLSYKKKIDNPLISMEEYVEEDLILISRKSFDKWLKQIENGSAESEPVLDTRSKNSYSNIIGALLEILTTDKHGVDKHFDSQDQLRDFLVYEYNGIYGMRRDNLGNKFAEANKTLKEYIEKSEKKSRKSDG